MTPNFSHVYTQWQTMVQKFCNRRAIFFRGNFQFAREVLHTHLAVFIYSQEDWKSYLDITSKTRLRALTFRTRRQSRNTPTYTLPHKSQ